MDNDRLNATRMLENLIGKMSQLLHGITSRTDPVQIAAEVVRLNGDVRDTARAVLDPFTQPADYAAVLIGEADSTHKE
jgi:hypothetical protein